MNLRTTSKHRNRHVTIIAAALIALSASVAVTVSEVANASLQTVASYQMNEGPGAAVMEDSQPFGLDGTIGTSAGSDVITGATHAGSTGYRWPWAAPDTSPLRPERIIVVDTDEHLNPGSAAFAIEIRYRTTEQFGNIVQKGQSLTQGGYWKMEQNNGVPSCLFRSTQQNQGTVIAPVPLADGQWHTVRCERLAGEVRMFVDGSAQPVDRQTHAVGAIANGFPMSIGGKSQCNQQAVGCDYFTGDIDYVQIDKDVPTIPNQPPVVTVTTDCVGLTCTVDSAASFDPDGDIVDRVWQLGDGSTTETQTTAIEHTFPAAGAYTVSVTGTDDDGASVKESATVKVGGSTSKFVPVTPARLFDTRPGEAPAGYKGVVRGGTSLTTQVTGRAGIPTSGVTAVAINLTGIGVQAPSFVSASPTESAQASTSSLNLVLPGEIRANLVIVPVSSTGTISLYTLRDAHLLGDVAGYFRPQATASDDGRIVTQTPRRLFDTRIDSILGPPNRIPARGEIAADVVGRAGVPGAGVEAVVMNVTATAPGGPGYVTVWPGGKRPTTSSLNVDGAGETVANQVIVPVGDDGHVHFYSSVGVDLVADVLGWVTADGAASRTTGLFVPVKPTRVFDTRPGESAAGPKGIVPSRGTISPEIGGVAGVPAAAGGVVLNVTMVGTGPGYATLWPTGAARPTTSNVNVDRAGDVRPNGAILRLGTGGRLDVYVLTQAHVLADVAGYLLE
jgi:hypothetical protein